ncbi:MAG: hypothetical protein ACKOOH_04830 [Cyanobium sp.]
MSLGQLSMSFGDAIAPLAAFWVALDGFLKIAAFTNGLRDSILSGKIGSNDITLAHKRVLYIDWKLTMAGYTGTVVVFGFILLGLAGLTGSKVPIQGLAFTVFVGAILFVICGIHDSRAIQQCITRQANDVWES